GSGKIRSGGIGSFPQNHPAYRRSPDGDPEGADLGAAWKGTRHHEKAARRLAGREGAGGKADSVRHKSVEREAEGDPAADLRGGMDARREAGGGEAEGQDAGSGNQVRVR